MRRGWTLVGEDGLDAVTVANLAKWQAVFSNWFPWSLAPAGIAFPETAEAPPRLAGAALGFSGGVDSTDVLVRRRLSPGAGRQAVATGLMIHGYDIPLAMEEGFAVRWRTARATLDRFGARGLRMRTNIRSLARGPYFNWPLEVHGIWLAAALSCLEPWHGELVVASSDEDSRPTIPWASNPITDPFLSGGIARVVNEGGDLSRLGKITLLAKAGALGDLRVCYERPESGENCGRCRKCLLLQLALESLGADPAGLFPMGVDPGFRRRFRTRMPCFKSDLLETAAAAAARGDERLAREIRGMAAADPWVAARDGLRRLVRRLR